LWIATTSTAVAAAAIVAVASLPFDWSTQRPATCLPYGCFCEAIRDQLVRQPANAVSALAFVFVGLLILLAFRPNDASTNPIRSQRVYTVLFGSAAMIIGIGSLLYHASLTFWAQTVDVLGMYLIVTLIIVYGMARLTSVSSSISASVYVAGNAVLLGGLIVFPEARREAFALLVVVAVGLELVARRRDVLEYRTGWFWAAVLLLVAASAVWTADITRTVCAPGSWLQGHALWHVAGAGAVWLMFQYYRSGEAPGGVGGRIPERVQHR
jgi:hypothetical protein